ncbi:MAG: arginine--tRNA ligase [Candidatus Saccharimonadales bacterium]
MQGIVQTVEKVCLDLFGVTVEVVFTRTEAQFGDYATNVAFQLTKHLSQSPLEIAQQIVQKIDHPEIAQSVVAGPGFINIFLTATGLINILNTPLACPYKYDVVVETNNPNPFKAMHIGHAFNAVLADTIANLIEQGGATVHRVSYHGDVGSHVGKSMWAILQWIAGDPAKLDTIAVDERNQFMSAKYAEGSAAYANDPSTKADIDRLAEQSFILDDPLYRRVYQACKDWSFNGIDEVVAQLGNSPIEKRYVESEADELGVETVKQHIGSVFIESEGALVFPGDKYGGFSNVFVSSKGRGLYGARDLGLMQLKQRDFQPKKSYIITAEEQRAYFIGVIKAAELCLSSLKNVTVNISTGTVKLATGKMSSRTGEVLDIAWLFQQVREAIEAQSGIVNSDTLVGVLRYEFLRVRIGSDVIFDVDQAISVQGNSGPYLQYSHARARSILAKIKPHDLHVDVKADSALQLDDAERILLRKISEFNEVVNRSVAELMPHHICLYLYELAQVFNRFYEKNRVIDDPRENIRLWLVQTYADNLKRGLALLNIPAPDRM